jgi:hypothetical protein
MFTDRDLLRNRGLWSPNAYQPHAEFGVVGTYIQHLQSLLLSFASPASLRYLRSTYLPTYPLTYIDAINVETYELEVKAVNQYTAYPTSCFSNYGRRRRQGKGKSGSTHNNNSTTTTTTTDRVPPNSHQTPTRATTALRSSPHSSSPPYGYGVDCQRHGTAWTWSGHILPKVGDESRPPRRLMPSLPRPGQHPQPSPAFFWILIFRFGLFRKMLFSQAPHLP